MAKAKNKQDVMETAKKVALFLDSLISEGGNITEACRISRVARSHVYKMEAGDPGGFGTAFREAQRHGLEVLEDEARRRAFRGTERPVFHKGEECGRVREYSDTLMIFLLKGGMPEKYTERQKHDLTSSDGSMSPVGAAECERRALEAQEALRRLREQRKEEQVNDLA